MNALLRCLVRMSMIVVLLAGAGTLYADTFDFTLSGTAINAGGIFTTDPESGGSFLVTSILGTQNFDTMTLLGVGTYGSNDNLLYYPNIPQLDQPGISYVAGGIDYNIYFPNGGSAYMQCNSVSDPSCIVGQGIPIQFTATPTPEPGTLALLSFGLAGLAGVKRRLQRA